VLRYVEIQCFANIAQSLGGETVKWRKDHLFHYGAGTIIYPSAKKATTKEYNSNNNKKTKTNLICTSYHIQNVKGIIALNLKPKSMKLLEVNKRKKSS